MKYVWLSWLILGSLLLVVCLCVGGMLAGTHGLALGGLVFLCLIRAVRWLL